MTPSQRAEQVSSAIYNGRKQARAQDRIRILKAIEERGPMTGAEIREAIGIGPAEYVWGLLDDLRKNHRLARDSSLRFHVTGNR